MTGTQSRKLQGRVCGVLVAVLVTGGLFAGLPSQGAASSCPVAREIDFLQPLRGLPPVRQIPENHHIPSSPRDLVAFSFPELLAGGGRAGLYLESRTNATHRLGWTVTSILKRINSVGSPRGIVRQRTVRLWSERSYKRDPAQLSVAVPARPGLYRSDTKIERPGRPPVTYSQYLRVVSPRIDVTLRLGQSSYSPGAVVTARLENRGTVNIGYSIGLELEKWDGQRWVQADDEHLFFPGSATSLSPGTAGPCEGIELPADLQPGNYRLSKTIIGGPRGVTARGYFQVASS
jgi:hypothetical protein